MIVQIRDICSAVYSGGTPNRKHLEYYEGGDIPWLNTSEVVFNRIYKTEKHITQSGLKNSSAKWIPENSVIVAMYGATAGRTAIAKKPLTTNQACCNLIIDPEKADYRYVYYYLYSKYQHLLSMANGGAQQNLNAGQIKEYMINLPDLQTQKKIADILDILDSKIELNNTINNNLLQQLHVLYLRLFGDSAMDTPLGDVVATTSGGTPSRKHEEYYSDSSICWVKSKELLGNYIHETEEHINDLAIKKSSAKLLPEHSVLIAMYGATVGAYGVISKPMTCNQAVCVLLCNKNYPYTYLFQIAYESQQKFVNFAVGSAQQNISQVLIKQLNLHSDLDIIQRFHDLALPMHQKIEFLQAENIRLSDLRDNLLPKLMSGEIDVSDIDL